MARPRPPGAALAIVRHPPAYPHLTVPASGVDRPGNGVAQDRGVGRQPDDVGLAVGKTAGNATRLVSKAVYPGEDVFRIVDMQL